MYTEKRDMTIQELEQCIAQYGKDLYSFCIHLARNREDADDLYQDTFLEAMKKLGMIRYTENPKSYLLSIAIRLWKNRMRKFAWRNRIAPQISAETAPELSGGELLLDIIAEEEKQMLWEALWRLPENLRIVLLLYYMEELSILEISKVLAIPQGTVKSRLYHARKHLEKDLEEDFI